MPDDFLPAWFQFWLAEVEEPRRRQVATDLKDLTDTVYRIERKINAQDALTEMSAKLATNHWAKLGIKAAIAAPIVACIAVAVDIVLKLVWHAT